MATTFTLTIHTGNAAFNGDMRGHEIARILRELANAAEAETLDEEGYTYDSNGNRVGNFSGGQEEDE